MLEAMKFQDGWSIRDGSNEVSYLKAADGWTGDLVDKVVRVAYDYSNGEYFDRGKSDCDCSDSYYEGYSDGIASVKDIYD